MLLTMFELIYETMNQSDEVWRWVHQKYAMIQIVKNDIHLKLTTDLTLLLPMMLYWINETINHSDEVCGWLHQKYVMSWIIQKLHLVWG